MLSESPDSPESYYRKQRAEAQIQKEMRDLLLIIKRNQAIPDWMLIVAISWLQLLPGILELPTFERLCAIVLGIALTTYITTRNGWYVSTSFAAKRLVILAESREDLYERMFYAYPELYRPIEELEVLALGA